MRPATQAERMKAAGRMQVLLWLSAEAKQRLERLAVAHDLTQVGVVEAALLAFEAAPHEQRPAGDETSAQIDMALRSVIDRIEALEKALAALTVEAASSYQHEPEAAEIGSCVAVGHNPSLLDDVGTLEADHPVISEVKESPEPGGMEKEAERIPFPILPNTHQGDEPRAFAELPESDKQHWRGVMLGWQRTGLSNPAISKRLWDEQRIGQYSFGKLAPLDRNRTKTEIDRAKGVK